MDGPGQEDELRKGWSPGDKRWDGRAKRMS